jgi:hypothetical protein
MKRKQNIGSVFEQRAFQFDEHDLVENAASSSSSSPSSSTFIDLFPIFGFPCVPHVGVYGADYQPTAIYVTLKLNLSQHLSALPPRLIDEFKLHSLNIDHGSLFILFHSRLSLDVHSDDDDNESPFQLDENSDDVNVLTERWAAKLGIDLNASDSDSDSDDSAESQSTLVNLMLHCWVYPSFDMSVHSVANDETLCGVFEAHGCVEYSGTDAANVSKEALVCCGSAPFDRLEQRQVLIHDGSMSPDNCQLRLLPASVEPVASFFSFAVHVASGRSVAALHIVANDEANDDALQSIAASSVTVNDLFTRIANTKQYIHISNQLNRFQI